MTSGQVCTHTVNTYPEQWATIYAAAPKEQIGVRCLAQSPHLSHGIEGGESAGHSLPPPTIPAGPETQTRDLRVTSPTLYLLGLDFRPPVVKWGVGKYGNPYLKFVFCINPIHLQTQLKNLKAGLMASLCTAVGLYSTLTTPKNRWSTIQGFNRLFIR